MRHSFFIFAIAFLLFSCATGQIYMAMEEAEAIVKNYPDPELKEKHNANEKLIREIYNRFTTLKVNFVRDGLGVMPVVDEKGIRRYYLRILIRPSEIRFDVNTTDAKKRFSEVLYTHLPFYLKYIKKEDLADFDGLTLGIYWPVRDFGQCRDYGGFIEYAHFNIPREEMYELLAGKKDLIDVLKVSEIVTSFNLESPKSVRIEF